MASTTWQYRPGFGWVERDATPRVELELIARPVASTNLTWHQQRAAGLHALPYEIVGYSWHASSYCPTCMIERLIANGYASPGARGMNAEEVLDQIAEANAIDRESEETFDSGDFPKVIFRDSAESYQDELGQAEACGSCWEVLA